MNKLLFITSIVLIFTACSREPSGETNTSQADQPTNKIDFLTPDLPKSIALTASHEDLETSNTEEDMIDWELSHRVANVIASDYSITENNKYISVTTIHGVVTLSGSVTSKLQRNKILKRVKSIEGVESVNNQLIVSKDQSSSQK